MVIAPYWFTAGGVFSPLDLSPALWVDPSDASTVTISGSSGAYIGASGLNTVAATGNYAQAPASGVLNLANGADLDVIVKATKADWTTAPGSLGGFVVRDDGAGRHWAFSMNSTGGLTFDAFNAAGTQFTYVSSVATGLAANATKWLRATLDTDNGSAGSDAKFYMSDDGVTWTQLGTTVTRSVVATWPSSTQPILVGAYRPALYPLGIGTIHRAIVKNGIGGTTVFDADFENATPFVSAFTESALGAPVYVVSSTATSATANYGYIGPLGLVLGGGVDYAITPDAAANSVTGDIEIVVRCALANWLTLSGAIFGKWNTTGGKSYILYTNASGALQLFLSSNGTANGSVTSSAAVPFANGEMGWVKATYRTSDRRVQFFTAADQSTEPGSWTQLGTDQTHAQTSIFDGTAALVVGANIDSAGQTYRAGTFARAIVRNGIGGTTAFDADFTTAPDYSSSFTEDSSNAATVTITATNTPPNAAGALVSQIDDKSGNARHLTQGTAANMPKYWNGRNGRNVLVFNGSDEHIGAVDWTGLTNNVFTAAFVRVNDTASSKIIAGFGADLYAMWSSSGELLASYITAGGVTSAGTMNRVIGSSCMTDASASAGRAWVDGTLTTGTTNSAATGGTLRLGQSGSSTLWFSGEVGELLIATTIPTSQQITDTHDYIKAAWGTP